MNNHHKCRNIDRNVRQRDTHREWQTGEWAQTLRVSQLSRCTLYTSAGVLCTPRTTNRIITVCYSLRLLRQQDVCYENWAQITPKLLWISIILCPRPCIRSSDSFYHVKRPLKDALQQSMQLLFHFTSNM